MISTDRRVRRLLRWYPPAWRHGHADEFAALLEDSMSDRPFWPRRGLDIAMQGSRLRLVELGGQLSARPQSPMSRALALFATSTALFAGYTMLFATTGLAGSFAHGFEDAALPVSLVVDAVVIIVGMLTFSFGLTVALRTRSLRASWPSIAFGTSLVAAVGCDWWVSSLGVMRGWASIRNAVVSLNPFTWQEAFFSTHVGRMIGDYRLYMVLNLCLLGIITVSGVALVRRLGASPHPARGARPVGALACASMLAVTISAWLWAADKFGRNPRSYELFFIPLVMTVAAMPALLAYFRSRRRRPVTLTT